MWNNSAGCVQSQGRRQGGKAARKGIGIEAQRLQKAKARVGVRVSGRAEGYGLTSQNSLSRLEASSHHSDTNSPS